MKQVKCMRLFGCLLAIVCAVGGQAWGMEKEDELSKEKRELIDKLFKGECRHERGRLLYGGLSSEEGDCILQADSKIRTASFGVFGRSRKPWNPKIITSKNESELLIYGGCGHEESPLVSAARAGCVASIRHILSFPRLKRIFYIVDEDHVGFNPTALEAAIACGNLDAAKELAKQVAYLGLDLWPEGWRGEGVEGKTFEEFKKWYEKWCCDTQAIGVERSGSDDEKVWENYDCVIFTQDD